jgi:hypothetical protein
MIDFERLVRVVVAFAGPKQWSEFSDMVKKKDGVERIYGEFIINKKLPFIDVIGMVNKFEKELPKGFKDEFVEYHKKFKEKQKQLSDKYNGPKYQSEPNKFSPSVVAQVDKFSIVNTYVGMTQEKTYETYKSVIELIQKAVDILKSKGFGSVIYGDILLKNPVKSSSVAEYNYVNDEIRLRFYRDYSGHALRSIIHEIAHRIWYKMMEHSDKKLWEQEYEQKMSGKYEGKNPGFPRDYSKTNVREYFATVIEEYLDTDKKYSELIDLIV